MRDGRITDKKSVLSGMGAVRVNPHNLMTERLGHRSFRIWGKAIRALGKQGQRRRLPLLLGYTVFLSVAIVAILPPSIAVRQILLLFPSYREKLRAEVERCERPSGR